MDYYWVAAMQQDDGSLLTYVISYPQTEIQDAFLSIEVIKYTGFEDDYLQSPVSIDGIDELKDRTDTEPGNYILYVADENKKIINICNHIGKYVKKTDGKLHKVGAADIFIYNGIEYLIIGDNENMSNIDIDGYNVLKNTLDIFAKKGKPYVVDCVNDYIWIPE